ncbi:MAG: DUF420 domain-containing protein [Nitrospiraceae bacterium]|nr:DUF420 domain-containing protein [Nitrospiraceae bacterium]
MDPKSWLWYGVVATITVAYVVALAGIRAAKHHDVSHHSRRMLTASVIVGLWLIAYVTKQVLFGREQFGGSRAEYWGLYVPVFSLHMLCACLTIAMGSYNLYMGFTRLYMGTGVGAMVAGVSLHRRLGRWIVWSFSGTMATAYLIYLMLFVWFPA